MFWAASCTKLITSIAAAQIVERGLITWDEDVSEFLPELKNTEILVIDSPDFDPAAWMAGQKQEMPKFHLEPAKNHITLRQLVSHTSGLSSSLSSAEVRVWKAFKNMTAPITGDLRKDFGPPIVFEPGTMWSYSPGLDWAGELVKKLNGNTSLEEYVKQNILEPLGLKDTTFRIENRPDMKERWVECTYRASDGTFSYGPHMLTTNPVDDLGGAGIYTTPNDYITILKDLIQDKPKLFKSPITVEKLFRPQFTPDEPVGQSMRDSHLMWGPQTGSLSFTKEEREKVADGLSHSLGGIVAYSDIPSLPKGSMSWGGLPGLNWFANRRKGVAGFFATQVLPYGDLKAVDLAFQFREEVWRRAAAA